MRKNTAIRHGLGVTANNGPRCFIKITAVVIGEHIIPRIKEISPQTDYMKMFSWTRARHAFSGVTWLIFRVILYWSTVRE